MKKKFSMDIASAIRTFLVEDDWNHQFDEQKGVFTFGLSLNGSKLQNVRYRIEVRESDFLIYVISPLGADKDDETMMARMAELLHKANYGIVNGNFEMDYRDGEIRYKVYVDCEDRLPTSAIIRNGIYCAASTYDRYGNAIINIIFTDVSPNDAYQESMKSHFSSLLSDDKEETEDTEESDSSEELADQLIDALFGEDAGGITMQQTERAIHALFDDEDEEDEDE